jgi:anti-sigma regulatory factor (Ser/Thr protein kinase)
LEVFSRPEDGRIGAPGPPGRVRSGNGGFIRCQAGTRRCITLRSTHRVFAPEPAEVGAVRRFVVTLAQRWGFDPEPAALVASELATNAVLHARSNFDVALRAEGDRLVVEVFDDNPRPPVPASPTPEALSGRGLMLVDAVALTWGIEETTDGKVVWAEL